MLFLALAALALPSKDNAQRSASVELILGSGSDRVLAGANADQFLIKRPLKAAAALVGDVVSSPSDETAEQPLPDVEPQAEEPNLAGLADIPEELITVQHGQKNDRVQRRPSFAAFSETRENLPWKAVEPVAFTPMGPGQQQTVGSMQPALEESTPLNVSDADIVKWTKGKATKIMGADRTKPLYHFVVWVEPPKAMQAYVAGVSYDFSSPAVRPQSQASSDRESGFKINAAGLACADEITVTLRFKDGRVEKTSIDGCKLFNKA